MLSIRRMYFSVVITIVLSVSLPRCGNVAAILELDEHLQREFIIFEAAPQETRGIPSKKPVADYFLWSLWADSHDVFKISGTIFFFVTSHPPSCYRTVLSVWTQSSWTKNKTKNLPQNHGRLHAASMWRAGFLPRCPKSDRAVTVKGEGDEVDTGPMTVVNSQLI